MLRTAALPCRLSLLCVAPGPTWGQIPGVQLGRHLCDKARHGSAVRFGQLPLNAEGLGQLGCHGPRGPEVGLEGSHVVESNTRQAPREPRGVVALDLWVDDAGL